MSDLQDGVQPPVHTPRLPGLRGARASGGTCAWARAIEHGARDVHHVATERNRGVGDPHGDSCDDAVGGGGTVSDTCLVRSTNGWIMRQGQQ